VSQLDLLWIRTKFGREKINFFLKMG